MPEELECECLYCNKRDWCMPGYSDKDLNWGAKEGHTPKKGECEDFEEVSD